jgi:hypothetical protein
MSENDLFERVKQNPRPVVVDFWILFVPGWSGRGDRFQRGSRPLSDLPGGIGTFTRLGAQRAN